MPDWLNSILNNPLLFIYILRVIAIILVTLGYGSLITTIIFLARSTRIKGTLVAWEKLTSHDIRRGAPSMRPSSRPVYRAVVIFAVDGKEYRVTGDVWSRKRGGPTRPTGGPMPVRYIPGHPDDARIATIVNLWFTPVIFSVIGSFLMLTWFD
jgi:hypothetical protein